MDSKYGFWWESRRNIEVDECIGSSALVLLGSGKGGEDGRPDFGAPGYFCKRLSAELKSRLGRPVTAVISVKGVASETLRRAKGREDASASISLWKRCRASSSSSSSDKRLLRIDMRTLSSVCAGYGFVKPTSGAADMTGEEVPEDPPFPMTVTPLNADMLRLLGSYLLSDFKFPASEAD